MSETLNGRRVLVTGATSGIGAAIAEAVVAAGGRVALVARSADDLARQAERLGDGAVAVPADVTDADAIAAAVEQAAEHLGGLDAVVCSAGVVHPGGILETTPSDWQSMFDVNVLGVLNTVHGTLDRLREADPADVVVVSSMSGRRRSSVAMGVYAASKFAVHVVSDSLREELAPEGVRVTVISPGFVDTPIFDHVADDETRARYQETVSTQGLDPAAVAANVVHALAQPAGVNLVEIAIMSTNQG
ncbi:MAG: oxidoreductase [Acidimicrobiaceae bacterium]|nr:oxidoreductase [Acidimicrobiaceae bacterium]